MKHAGYIARRISLLMADAVGRRMKRSSFFRRMIEALHISRRRQARQLIRRYRHLLAEDLRGQPASTLDFNSEKEGRQNAKRNQAAVRAVQRTYQGA